jgi:hypothetical protein
MDPEIVGKSRIGDIRHCFCDGSLAADRLGFRATKDFRGRPGRTRRMGRRSRPPTTASTRPEPNWKRGAGRVSRDDLPKADDARAILITGGAGFIGANIADRLAGQGHRVLSTTR